MSIKVFMCYTAVGPLRENNLRQGPRLFNLTLVGCYMVINFLVFGFRGFCLGSLLSNFNASNPSAITRNDD